MLRNSEYEDLEKCEACELECHDECPNNELSGYDTPVCGCERCLK